MQAAAPKPRGASLPPPRLRSGFHAQSPARLPARRPSDVGFARGGGIAAPGRPTLDGAARGKPKLSRRRQREADEGSREKHTQATHTHTHTRRHSRIASHRNPGRRRLSVPVTNTSTLRHSSLCSSPPPHIQHLGSCSRAERIRPPTTAVPSHQPPKAPSPTPIAHHRLLLHPSLCQVLVPRPPQITVV